MKGNLGKGTDIFKFFGEYFKLCSEYWLVESNESYWENLLKDSEKMLEKYKKCDFYQFAKALVLVLNIYLSDVKYKYKGQTKGHWSITFKGEKES